MGYIIRCGGSLSHSSGPWKKHKYLRKEGKKYVYANTTGPGSNAHQGYMSGQAFGKKVAALFQKLKSKWFSFTAKSTAAFNAYVERGKAFANGFASSFAYNTAPSNAMSRNVNDNAARTNKVQNLNNSYNSGKVRPKVPAAMSKNVKKHADQTHKVENLNKSYNRGKSRVSPTNASLAYETLQKKANVRKSGHTYHTSGGSSSSGGKHFNMPGSSRVYYTSNQMATSNLVGTSNIGSDVPHPRAATYFTSAAKKKKKKNTGR